jgi:hypothetical protein
MTATAAPTAIASAIAANGAVYRTFSVEESSAIYNLHIEQEGYIEVIFQSNTDRAYSFTASVTFCEDLIDILSYSDLRGESLGRVIAQARKNGDMEAIEYAD